MQTQRQEYEVSFMNRKIQPSINNISSDSTFYLITSVAVQIIPDQNINTLNIFLETEYLLKRLLNQCEN